MNRLPVVLILLVTFAAGPVAWSQEAAPPLTLDDCLALALQHNPQLVTARQSVVIAGASVRQARSGYAPQLTLDASTGVDGSSGGAMSTGQSDSAASLILGMTFWRSGRDATVAQSRANARAATQTYADRRLGLAGLIADDYFAVLAATELLAVAKSGVEVAEQHRQQVAAQIEQGSVAAVEIHTVDNDLAQARLDLIDARGTVRSALAALKTDMGMPNSAELQLAPALLGTQEPPPAESDAVAAALDRRPDLQAQRAAVEARKQGVRVARANRGPVVELGGQASNSVADGRDNQSAWSLTAGVTWPLADGGYTAAAHTTARANLISAEAGLQDLANQATLEVQQTLIELDRTAERIKASEEALTTATARLNAAEVKYREGLGILIEVTDARQAVTSAEAEAVRARYAYQVARNALQVAMATFPLPAEPTETAP